MPIVPRDTDAPPERTALYRLFDADDELLYVGISKDPKARWEQHRDKPWWRDVSMRVIEWYDDRPTAERAERKAIETEGPRYNIVHNYRPAAPTVEAPVEETERGYTTLSDLYPDGIGDERARKIVALLRLGDVR